jgi:protocadherin alpha
VDCEKGEIKSKCIDSSSGNQEVCSGNGYCDCGNCACDKGYSGTYCEKCVTCPSKCPTDAKCVLCQGFGQCEEKGPGSLAECNLNIKMMNKTDEFCSIEDGNNCWVLWNYLEEPKGSGNETVLIQREKNCIIVTVTKPPILAIILGTIGGIVLLGLLLLLLWKILIVAYDRYEYQKFEKDRMKSKWEKSENPIYKRPNQQFQNPTFAGNK